MRWITRERDSVELNRSKRGLIIRFSILLFFATIITACNNTCFVFTSNPPNGTLHIKASNPPPACTLGKANGAVTVRLVAQSVCNSCVESSQIQHIFLSIQNIALNPSPTADDHSADWEELLSANTANEPLQVDLVRGTGDQSPLKPLEEFTIPAGIYSQVRLRFTKQPIRGIRVAEGNDCGGELFNCVVMADGRTRPLVFPSLLELRITLDRMKGETLFIPPDTHGDLVIELTPRWAWSTSPAEGMRLVATLAGTAKIVRVGGE